MFTKQKSCLSCFLGIIPLLTEGFAADSLLTMYPILLKIPFIDLPIYSYGVMLGLSLVVGWYIIMKLGRQDGLPQEKMATCFVLTAIAAIFGARLLYILTNLGEYDGAGILDLLNMRKGGLVAYGGFLGGFFGSWIYLKTQRIRLLPWADVVALTLSSGLGITRIGCLMFGCDYGRPIPEDAPGWVRAIGIRFPNWEVAFPEITRMFEQKAGCMSGVFHGAPAFQHHVSMGLVASGDAFSAPVIPTQIMASLNGWLVFAILLFVIRPRTRFRGQCFLFFTAYYGITRALMELVRGDTQRGGIGVFSTSQIVGLATLLLSLVAWFILAQRARKDPVAAMALGPGARVDDVAEPFKPRKRSSKKKRYRKN